MAQVVALSLALAAVGGGALVFGITRLQHEPPAEAGAATLTPVTSPTSLGVQDLGLATAQAEKDNLAATLSILPSTPANGNEPAIDIARIEQSGDAVIAGSAVPGASVELLRNGEVHDRVVADRSGQFVIVPPRLPPGDYELTLRSKEPDGRQAVFKQRVVVAIHPDLKEGPPITPTTDRTGIGLSKSSDLSPRRGRFHAGKPRSVAVRGFRNPNGRYGFGGFEYGDYPYNGYGYGCWLPGPYGGSIYVCY